MAKSAAKKAPASKAVTKSGDGAGSKAVTISSKSMRATVAQHGSGMDNVTASDLLIPRVTILQGLSPQVIKTNSEYIKGAEPGIICDVGLRQLLGTEITVLPCFYAKIYLEWAPRGKANKNAGGQKGLINNWGTDPSILTKTRRDDKGKAILPNGNYIAETATFYCLNLSASNRRCFIPLASTQLQVAKSWLTRINAVRWTDDDGEYFPGMYAHAWTLGVTSRSNDDGDWYVFTAEAAMAVNQLDNGEALLREAIQFMEQSRAGLVRADVSSMSQTETGREADDGARDGAM